MGMQFASQFRHAVLAASAVLFLSFTASASAQVLVYKMGIEAVRSVNLDFYNEGYFVVPAAGGAGSFLFTVNTRREKSYSDTGTGNLSFALTSSDELKSVVTGSTTSSTTNTTASSSSTFVAFGTVNRKVSLNGPTFETSAKIAPKLRGGITAFAIEPIDSTTEEAGFAGVFDFSLNFDRKRTESSNAEGLTVAETITAIIAELKKAGYVSETAPATQPETPPTTTTP